MGCRRVAPQSELVRVVRSPEATLLVSRTLPGRGAWLCAGSPACAAEAARRKAFGRALRGRVDASSVAELLGRLGAGQQVD